jgi:hypothetical protein
VIEHLIDPKQSRGAYEPGYLFMAVPLRDERDSMLAASVRPEVKLPAAFGFCRELAQSRDD